MASSQFQLHLATVPVTPNIGAGTWGGSGGMLWTWGPFEDLYVPATNQTYIGIESPSGPVGPVVGGGLILNGNYTPFI
jgi:hypothetical protein